MAYTVTDRRNGRNWTEEEREELTRHSIITSTNDHVGILSKRDSAAPSRSKRIGIAKKYLGKLLPEYMLVLELDPPKKSGNIIIIPDSAKNRPTVGEVIIKGEAVKRFDLGDTVMYALFSGEVIPFRGYRYRIMKETEPLCAIEMDQEIQESYDSGKMLAEEDAYAG